MADVQVWKAINALKSLLELVPDSPGGPSRLDACVDWARQVVEFVTYPPAAVPPPDTERVAAECLRQIETFTEKLTAPVGGPPATPEIGAPTAGPKYVGVPFPYELDGFGKSAVARGEESSGAHSLWHTTRPWDAINHTIAGLRDVLPQVLDAVEMDPTLKKRLAEDFGNRAGFLEEDMRGTVWGYVSSDRPVDEKMRSRNNGRLDALGVFLAAVRAKPEIVMEAAAAILQRARATVQGWVFDVHGGRVTHNGVTMPDLSPEAVFFLKAVVEAAPGYVQLEVIKRGATAEGVTITADRVVRLISQLPTPLREQLETKRGAGTRLKPMPGSGA